MHVTVTQQFSFQSDPADSSTHFLLSFSSYENIIFLLLCFKHVKLELGRGLGAQPQSQTPWGVVVEESGVLGHSIQGQPGSQEALSSLGHS